MYNSRVLSHLSASLLQAFPLTKTISSGHFWMCSIHPDQVES